MLQNLTELRPQGESKEEEAASELPSHLLPWFCPVLCSFRMTCSLNCGVSRGSQTSKGSAVTVLRVGEKGGERGAGAHHPWRQSVEKGGVSPFLE